MSMKSSEHLSQCVRDVLSKRGWLSTQSEDFQEAIFRLGEVRELDAGLTLFGEGDSKIHVQGIISGRQDILIAPHSGPPVMVHLAGPGEWVGGLPASAGGTHRGTVITRTRCLSLFMNECSMRLLANEFPDLRSRFATLVSLYSDFLLSALATQAERDVETRVKHTLLRLIGEDFLPGHDFPPGPVELPIAQGDIAEITFLTRNSVGPVLRRLEQQGAIVLGYRKTTIVDRSLLRS